MTSNKFHNLRLYFLKVAWELGFGDIERICDVRHRKNSYDIDIYCDVDSGCDIQTAKQVTSPKGGKLCEEEEPGSTIM